MNSLLSFMVLAVATPTARPCLGVAIQSQRGPINLLGFSAVGYQADVDRVIAADNQIGGEAGKPERGDDGRWTVRFLFPSPPVHAAAAVDLVQRARSGAFGPLIVETMTRDIETLPADKCPRN